MKFLCSTLLLPAAFVLRSAEPRWDPVERYETRLIEGWTWRVHQDLLAQKPLAAGTLRLLEFQPGPIPRAELKQHDPEMFALPAKLWEMPGSKTK